MRQFLRALGCRVPGEIQVRTGVAYRRSVRRSAPWRTAKDVDVVKQMLADLSSIGGVVKRLESPFVQIIEMPGTGQPLGLREGIANTLDRREEILTDRAEIEMAVQVNTRTARDRGRMHISRIPVQQVHARRVDAVVLVDAGCRPADGRSVLDRRDVDHQNRPDALEERTSETWAVSPPM